MLHLLLKLFNLSYELEKNTQAQPLAIKFYQWKSDEVTADSGILKKGEVKTLSLKPHYNTVGVSVKKKKKSSN